MLQGGNVARCVAVWNRDIRVSDGLPAVAESRKRRPAVRPVSALAREQRRADARETAETLQAHHLQSPEDVPQVSGTAAGEKTWRISRPGEVP